MYFRNAALFRLAPAFAKNLPDFNDALGDHRLRPCGPLEVRTVGFVPPLGGEHDPLTFRIGNAILFTLGSEEKVLPSATVNAALKVKLEAYAKQHGRPAGGKARRALKAEVLDALLQRALTKPSRISGYLDTGTGWLVIDTTSNKRAEEVLTALRLAFGSLPAVPAIGEKPVRGVLTEWLARADLPGEVGFGDECELKEPAGGAVARCGKQELESREVQEHIKAGKQCIKLGLTYGDHVSFVLRENLSLAKVRLLDGALESLDESAMGDAESEFAARAALMTGELDRLLVALADWFDIVEPDGE